MFTLAISPKHALYSSCTYCRFFNLLLLYERRNSTKTFYFLHFHWCVINNWLLFRDTIWMIWELLLNQKWKRRRFWIMILLSVKITLYRWNSYKSLIKHRLWIYRAICSILIAIKHFWNFHLIEWFLIKWKLSTLFT